MRSALAPVCLLTFALAPPADAQTYRPVTAKDLLQNTSRHLKRRIELKDVYCYGLEDAGGFECGTGEPLIVRAKAMAEGPLKAKIEAECGGLDAIERTPTCRVNLRFVPAAVTKEQGEVVLNGKLTPGDVTVITADTVTPAAAQ
jgi:hypothetical protein